MVREVTAFSFTSDARTSVEQIEYLSELPTLWPVPRVRTAFVLDLSDPKFNILDENGSFIPVDVLVSGQDNDSWKGSSGAADPTVDGKSRGHLYWIACDGWTPHFNESHRTHSIPDNVDEGLIKLFDGKPLADDDSADTNECSRIVHPHTGGHPHNIKGKAVAQCPIVHRACKCKRTYYVLVDRTIRKLIFHPNGLPHNHPILPPLKPGHDAKSKYRQCRKYPGVHALNIYTFVPGPLRVPLAELTVAVAF
ncbi:hypothetical protein MVEN_00011700 [Mycena venus]|uniref:Uncharacterized protein n=1 Tax=Mycena venus TaxID=2733690 RepID=A0A8H6Z5X0_9AGAR|nr:hypothetical protein MVEN_00011700 [Mycena venus]